MAALWVAVLSTSTSKKPLPSVDMGNRPPMRTDKFVAGVPSTAFTVWPWTLVLVPGRR